MGVQEAEKLKQICSVIHQTVDTEKNLSLRVLRLRCANAEQRF